MRFMSRSFVLFISFALGGTLPGGDAKKANEAELKKIQGTWRFIAQDIDGKPRPAEQLTNLIIQFAGETWTIRDNNKIIQGGVHKLDPTKNPNQVDAKVTVGEDKGSAMLGIYELKGDTLKVCFDPKGNARPASFKSKEGQFSAVLRLQPEKKKP
jgi:uncharacterized protein (TIGR03067 family)